MKYPIFTVFFALVALSGAVFFYQSQDISILGDDASAQTTTQKSYTKLQITALAGDTYKKGGIPIGDNKYSTKSAKKGYIYLCSAHSGGGGAQADGPWIHDITWNPSEKVSVSGEVSWKDASFQMTTSSTTRTLSGNNLPINHTTGTFPVGKKDTAYQYDRNPNTIASQSLLVKLPKTPTYSTTPTCVGGEVGVMLSGVPIFNGFDALLRDAGAHEVQDGCEGHPEKGGKYHYHNLSSCFKDTSIETVLGFAYDGFAITGPLVGTGKYLTTDDLDECHGITSQIILDGKKTTIYHYVMTADFPYSVGCYRSKPITLTKGEPVSQTNSSSAPQTNSTAPHTPPQPAYDACNGKSSGATCTLSTPKGSISGICLTLSTTTSLFCKP